MVMEIINLVFIYNYTVVCTYKCMFYQNKKVCCVVCFIFNHLRRTGINSQSTSQYITKVAYLWYINRMEYDWLFLLNVN